VPAAVSHSQAVASKTDKARTLLPSGENTTPVKWFLLPSTSGGGPVKRLSSAAVAESHSRADMSHEAVRTLLPSDEKTALETPLSWPANRRIARAPATSQMRTCLS